ncbi:hypothetical protein FQZ97_876640 [compost metagenome]
MVGGCLGPLRAAGDAGAPPDASITAVIRPRRNRIGARPPVPAELVHPGRGLHADLADRQCRHRKGFVLARIRRIARQTGNAHLHFELLVERGELFVGEGPVFSHPIQRLDPEVRGHEALPMASPQQGRTALGAVHQRIDIGLRGIDRIVGLKVTNIRIRVPALLRHQLPFRLVASKLAVVDLRALLQADHAHSRFCQVLGSHCTRSAGADDQGIDNLGVQTDFRHALHLIRLFIVRQRFAKGTVSPGLWGSVLGMPNPPATGLTAYQLNRSGIPLLNPDTTSWLT